MAGQMGGQISRRVLLGGACCCCCSAPVAAADPTALRRRPPSLPLPPCPLQKQAGLDGIIFDDVAKVAKVRPGAKGGKGAFSICGLSTLSLLHGLRDLRLLLPPGPTCLCATSRPPLCRALPCQRAARNPPPQSTSCSTFHSTRTPDRWDQKPCGCPRPPPMSAGHQQAVLLVQQAAQVACFPAGLGGGWACVGRGGMWVGDAYAWGWGVGWMGTGSEGCGVGWSVEGWQGWDLV